MIMVKPEAPEELLPGYAAPLSFIGGLVVFHLIALNGRLTSEILPSPSNLTLHALILGNLFHADWMHLIGNSVFLFFAGWALLAFVRWRVVLSLFLLSGMFGMLCETLSMILSGVDVPMLGASAGLFGLFGSFAVFNFHFRSRYAYWNIIWFRTIMLPTGLFFLWDTLLADLVIKLIESGAGYQSNVAHTAHVGGFVAGALLTIWYRKRRKWGAFTQTATEQALWHEHQATGVSWETLRQLYEINPINTPLKIEILDLKVGQTTIDDPEMMFRLMTPTFIRQEPELSAVVIRRLMLQGVPIPETWLVKIDFDIFLLLLDRIRTDLPGKVAAKTLLELYVALPSLSETLRIVSLRILEDLKAPA